VQVALANKRTNQRLPRNNLHSADLLPGPQDKRKKHSHWKNDVSVFAQRTTPSVFEWFARTYSIHRRAIHQHATGGRERLGENCSSGCTRKRAEVATYWRVCSYLRLFEIILHHAFDQAKTVQMYMSTRSVIAMLVLWRR